MSNETFATFQKRLFKSVVTNFRIQSKAITLKLQTFLAMLNKEMRMAMIPNLKP